MAQRVTSRRKWLGAREQLDKRRFPRAVYTHQRDAVSALDDEARAAEDLFHPVALGDILELLGATTRSTFGLGAAGK